MKLKSVSAETVTDILCGRAGLIIGPGATVNDNIYVSIAKQMGLTVDTENPTGLGWIGSQIRSRRLNEEEARNRLKEFYSAIPKSPYIRHLVEPNWKAVLSLSIDSHFEDSLQTKIDRKPARRPLSIVTDLTAGYPRRSIPLFKLQGSLSIDRFSLYEEDILLARSQWRTPLSEFCDTLGGSPAICLGGATDQRAFLDLVSEMLANKGSRVSSLILMADDPMVQCTPFLRLIDGRIPCYTFSDSLSLLVGRITSQEIVGHTALLPFTDSDESTAFQRYDDICKLVRPVAADTAQIPKEAVMESLFSPSVADWLPFQLKYDFARTICPQLLSEIQSGLTSRDSAHNAVVLSGSAANGKTTLLKRAAYELASNGILVLWITAAPIDAPDRLFHELFRDLRELHTDALRIVIVIDDPIHSRRGDVDVILSNAASHGFSTTLVIGIRSSEWDRTESFKSLGRSTVAAEVLLDDQFTPDETDRLPSYLVSIGAAKDLSSAKSKLDHGQTSSARDVLNTLYLAVPNTRAVIIASLRDEYCRLLNLGGLRQVVAGALKQGTDKIKFAYELTAVANLYGTDLPLQVMRAALAIDWHDIKDFLASNSALWGLLYPIEDGDDFSFKARNEIVVETIVDLVNGGPHGRSGEFRILQALVRACNGKTAASYRSFLAKLLIANQSLTRISYEDGLELYDEALTSLHQPDKVLLHHKGIWHAKHFKPTEALAVYREALSTPVFRYTESGESDGNITTSMAAAVVAQIKSGAKEIETGKQEAVALIQRAKTLSVANAHAVHVNANLAIELLKALPEKDTGDRLELAATAIGDIDKLALLEESPVAVRRVSQKSTTLLEDARGELYRSVLPKLDEKDFAMGLWNKSKHQDAFVLVARKMLDSVRKLPKPRGRDYLEVFNYLIEIRTAIESAGQFVDHRLTELQVDTFYWWRIHRAMLSPLETPIDWQLLLKLLLDLDLRARNKANIFHRFLQAMTFAHLEDWISADNVFAELRSEDLPQDVLFLPRGYLLNEKGGRTTVQGSIREHTGRKYFWVEKYDKSFHTERRDRWSANGEIDHAHILFCFAGPRAVHDS